MTPWLAHARRFGALPLAPPGVDRVVFRRCGGAGRHFRDNRTMSDTLVLLIIFAPFAAIAIGCIVALAAELIDEEWP